MSSASNKHRKCHILLGLKNIQMFDRAIRAEELGTFHPSCLPNLCFKKTILSDQLILCGQAGIDPKLKNPVLFVHKKEFALNYSKLTSDLPVNVVMALNREEIFESESEGDDDEIEEFQESSGDEVVIINELKGDGKNQNV